MEKRKEKEIIKKQRKISFLPTHCQNNKKGDLACSSDILLEKAGIQVVGRTDWRNSVERQEEVRHKKYYLINY